MYDMLDELELLSTLSSLGVGDVLADIYEMS
jgi:hypothetical protein